MNGTTKKGTTKQGTTKKPAAKTTAAAKKTETVTAAASKPVAAKAPAPKAAAPTKAAPKKAAAPQVTPGSTVTPEERWHMISVSAYFRAEQRGFVGGDPAADWHSAEAEIDTMLANKKMAMTK